MPEIIERDGKYCLEGYGDADACYDSEDEAKAAQAKLMSKELTIADTYRAFYERAGAVTTPPNWLTKEQAQQILDAKVAPVSDVLLDEKGELTRLPADKFTDEDAIAVRLLEKGIADRIWDGIKARLGWKDADEATGFKVAGNHWLATWSNNFKDRDGEVFPESAIDTYVRRVDMGVTPLPELWVWHAGKNVSIGSAAWVGRHGHFVMAGGEFYGAAPAQTAKAYYTRHANDTGISHGFTYPPDQFDGKHYGSFSTFEISLLPRGTEANWYTSLEGVKAMALDDKKVKYLKDVFGEEHATRILADWDARGKALEDLQVEFKDFTSADAQAAAADKAVTNADKAFTDLVPDLMEGSAEAVTAALEAVKLVKAQNAVIAQLQREVAETKALVEQRPRASQSPETVVETSHLSATLQKALKEQNTSVDNFTGLQVTKS